MHRTGTDADAHTQRTTQKARAEPRAPGGAEGAAPRGSQQGRRTGKPGTGTKTGTRTGTRTGLGLALGLACLLAGCAQHGEPPVAICGKPDGIYQASGNEPFWTMTLAQNMLTLETPDGPHRAEPVLHAHAEHQNRTYETRTMRVNVTARACSDSMTGQSYADTVRIVTQGRTLTGCGGAPLALTSLNDTRWVVTEMDGHRLADGRKPPSETDRTTDLPGVRPGASDMAPTLDINDSGKVSGSDGCNRYVGGMEFGRNGRVRAAVPGGLSSLMACPGRGDELARQFSSLTNAVTHWRMDGTTLVLETADRKTIRLRQVF